jgi:hypothetical protein
MAVAFSRSTRRLPGFRFEAQAPRLSEVLPRMDVAVFVGFAASGPVDTPVSVESAAQFSAIFGEDAPLAFDPRTGSNITAFLAPAVRAFFRNGGRRCWIVRVARRECSILNPLNRAQYNYFRVPGLSGVKFDDNGKIVRRIKRGYVRARSEGSWSDSLRVGAALMSRPLRLLGDVREGGGELSVHVEVSPSHQIGVGDLIKLEYNDSTVLFIAVDSIGPESESSPPAPASPLNSHSAIQIKSKRFVWLKETLTVKPLTVIATGVTPSTRVRSASLLSFELWVQDENKYLISVKDLAFEEGHKRFWGNLPTDEDLYSDVASELSEPPAILLWKPVGDIFRFPLAGAAETSVLYFPTTMSAVPDPYGGRVQRKGTKLERDGLAEFDSNLFLDEELKDASTEDLVSRADHIRYQSSLPRALKGIHSAFGIEEATIIAVPDAVHLGWLPAEQELPPPAIDDLPPYRPAWWHFADCKSQATGDPEWSLRDCDPAKPLPSETEKRRIPRPLLGNFLNCDIEVVEPPTLKQTKGPSGSGTIHLSWKSPAIGADFVLEESSNRDFTDPVAVYAGTNRDSTIYGRKAGNYYYRVRAQVGRNVSDWSRGIAVGIRNETGWQSIDESALGPDGEPKFRSDTLIAVHRSLLRMSTARGDLFAVLCLPEHFREDQSTEFATTIRATSEKASPTQGVAAFGSGELQALSYGAVYHPWTIAHEETQSSQLRSAPPCGSICGVMASRSIERGAWVAPANEALRGVVALNPQIGRDRRLDLQEANINLIRREPRGFLVLDADTLSGDFDLRQVNVRRLLSLLRRVAIKLGATYVFEPHNEAFGRLVKRGFEVLLDRLFERGAFAGTTADTSYQVVVDDSLNSRNSVEQGRFIVELRVAPSLPLRFLTVRLVQTNDRGFVSERGNS